MWEMLVAVSSLPKYFISDETIVCACGLQKIPFVFLPSDHSIDLDSSVCAPGSISFNACCRKRTKHSSSVRISSCSFNFLFPSLIFKI